jgi:uncharacterized Zn finger protein
MSCPICGKNDWQRIVKKVRPNPLLTYADKQVVIYKCNGCGYEKKSPDE